MKKWYTGYPISHIFQISFFLQSTYYTDYIDNKIYYFNTKYIFQLNNFMFKPQHSLNCLFSYNIGLSNTFHFQTRRENECSTLHGSLAYLQLFQIFRTQIRQNRVFYLQSTGSSLVCLDKKREKGSLWELDRNLNKKKGKG